MQKLLVATLLACLVTEANACSCEPLPDVAGELGRSDLVADATVLSVEDQFVGWRKIKGWFQWRFGPPFPTVLDDGFAVKFRTHATWKGVSGPEFTLYTPRHPNACGITFKPGDRYVVYATLFDKVHYEVDKCSRTQPRGNDEIGKLNGLSSTRPF